jgi:SprT-like protein
MELLDEKLLYQFVDELSRKYFKKPFTDQVKFNNRLRTTGGRYLPAKRTIELNPKYYIEMREEFVGIIKHELCHYHLHIEGKGYKHGDPEFKRLLKETGSPRYCKPLPSAQKMYKHLYRCKQCHFEYKRARRVNTKRYRCGKCQGVLEQVK